MTRHTRNKLTAWAGLLFAAALVFGGVVQLFVRFCWLTDDQPAYQAANHLLRGSILAVGLTCLGAAIAVGVLRRSQ